MIVIRNDDGTILLRTPCGSYEQFSTQDDLEIYAYKNKIPLGETSCTRHSNTLKKWEKQ